MGAGAGAERVESYAGVVVVKGRAADGEAWEVEYELGSIDGWLPYELVRAPMAGAEDGTDNGTEDGSVEGGVGWIDGAG